MSINATQSNLAYKKPKPGLSLSSGTASNSLKTALSSLKSTSSTKSSSASQTLTSGTVSKTTNTQTKSNIAKLASSNLSTTSSSNIFSSGKYDSYGNRVGGTRFVNANDYKLSNVEFAFGKYSADPTAATPRSQRRADRQLQKLIEWQNKQYQEAIDRQKCADIATKFANISGVISSFGNLSSIVTSLIQSKQAANNAPVEVSNSAGSEVKAAVSNLNSASTSAEIQEGLETVNAQIESKTKLSESYETQIQADSEAKTEAENDLSTIKNNISNTNTEIRGCESQLTKLQSQLENAQASGQDTISIETQIRELKEKKTKLESDLEQFKKDEEATTTTISNLDQSIQTNTQEKEKVDSDISSLNSTKSQFEAKQTKMEKSESKDLEKMNKQLTKLNEQIQSETDESKKTELTNQYKQLAGEFNEMLANTTVQHNYQKISV